MLNARSKITSYHKFRPDDKANNVTSKTTNLLKKSPTEQKWLKISKP